MTTPQNQPLVLNPMTELPEKLRGGVVAIGNFDGVHQGHQSVLQQARDQATALNVPLMAMTFEPHPRRFFKPGDPVFRLTPAREKATLLSACGVHAILETPFTKDFSSQSAEAFVDDVLMTRLGVKAVVIGFDFHFGANRTGTPAFLQAAGAAHGFSVNVIEAHGDETGSHYASSRIRALLADGDLASATEALGYRWFVTGTVRHGEKRGRDLGYPTANMTLDPSCRLRHGIYAVRMLVDGEVRDGVANFGRRPTFDNGAPLLETFLFDFSGDLYGKQVIVILEAYQRPELAFTNIDDLILQMDRDSEDARAHLATAPAWNPLEQATFSTLLAQR